MIQDSSRILAAPPPFKKNTIFIYIFQAFCVTVRITLLHFGQASSKGRHGHTYFFNVYFSRGGGYVWPILTKKNANGWFLSLIKANVVVGGRCSWREVGFLNDSTPPLKKSFWKLHRILRGWVTILVAPPDDCPITPLLGGGGGTITRPIHN